MQYSRKIQITEANSRMSKLWAPVSITWSRFVERLQSPKVTSETIDEYLNFKKSKQDEIKDVGGFVGGSLKGNLRRNHAVTSRSLVTLDLDNLAYLEDEEVLKTLHGLGCGFVVYSTRKHTKTKPRIRVIFPLGSDVSVEEYEPIARKLASFLGMRYCDPTTFQAVRLMYWPSHSSDSDYLIEYADKPMVDGKALLKMYEDWQDVRQWPQVPGAEKLHQNIRKNQADPLAKEGIVGAFCRRYGIRKAIEEFLPGEYEECDVPDRLTFVGGSTTAGAVVYDDVFLYSHHATDPCSQKLVNAFDLVRLHKFGHQDESAEEGTPVGRLPSYIAMKEFLIDCTPVKTDMWEERQSKAIQEFSVTPLPAGDIPPEVLKGEIVKDDIKWKEELDCNKDGWPKKTALNIRLILKNDPALKGKIFVDEFSSHMLARKGLPWDKHFQGEDRMWADIDDAGVRAYFESMYKIVSVSKIADGVNLTAEENKENKVAMWLQSTSWDGVERLETLFIDYLGCEDNIYTREIAKKSLVAAVRRAITGGGKFDYMPIIIGPQGVGKSTFLKILGHDWFNDSITKIEGGKEACELIQGSWIIELGELAGMRKSDIDTMKNFVSRQDDIFRASFGRRAQKYPRRCVFFGTANDYNFLRDETGNRRFWPIDSFVNTCKKSIFKDLKTELKQVWAEACEIAKDDNFSLELTEEAKAIAEIEQEGHKEENVQKGIIKHYLDKKLPKDWKKLNLTLRRVYLNEYEEQSKLHLELFPREKVCVLEIWEEALGNDKRFLKLYESKNIASILASLKDWERIKTNARFGEYGTQKGFRRKMSTDS